MEKEVNPPTDFFKGIKISLKSVFNPLPGITQILGDFDTPKIQLFNYFITNYALK